MGDYDGSLCKGLPALWPRPPRWCTSPAFEAKLLEGRGKEFHMMAKMMDPVRHQRLLDAAWLHFNALVEAEETSGTKRNSQEWIDLLCTPSGWDGEPLLQVMSKLSAAQPNGGFELKCGAKEFGTVYARYMKILPDAGDIRRPTLPRKCDECKKVCESECGLCGEAFCSRACLKKNFNSGHREACEMVYDNGGNLGSLFTTIEMQQRLTAEELAAATGRAVTGNGGRAGSAGDRVESKAQERERVACWLAFEKEQDLRGEGRHAEAEVLRKLAALDPEDAPDLTRGTRNPDDPRPRFKRAKGLWENANAAHAAGTRPPRSPPALTRCARATGWGCRASP